MNGHTVSATQKTASSGASNQQLLRLSLLLLMEQRLREAPKEEIPFIVVNETSKIIRYQQAILWQPHLFGPRGIRGVSGVSIPDSNSPFFQAIQRLLPRIQREITAQVKPRKDDKGDLDGKKPNALKASQFSHATEELQKEWLPENILWIPLIAPGGDVPAFLILFRPEPFTEPDINIVSHLASTFGHALAYEKLTYKPFTPFRKRLKRFFFTAILLTLSTLFCVFPIRQFSMAPSEIVAKAPTIVRAPMDGLIKTIFHTPNTFVKKGDPILEFDDITLKNRRLIAEKKLQIVKVQLLQSQQMAFGDQKAKGKIDLFNVAIKQEQAEVDYIDSLLKRVKVLAPHDGILIFQGKDEWVGRPASIGEIIMLLADPDEIELKISMPVNEAIELRANGDVNFFLNIAPASPIKASVRSINYSTHLTPNQVMAYGIRAEFEQRPDLARIGLRGTSKLYGPKTTLGLWVLRKPINLIQQWITR